ncbi:dihydroorotate dehydrogenase-like protein [Desulfatitalea alkaliphila]|uniref:Dihydroorotate dehydrogenase-like protein n=1 Tax=Desulfatitalea alkaliphila TaxID=2929485 RepID=A0AA41R2M7_9BACT|nr:dihydroorotate dehydrogenase-like protein [Desulfatitalea alkaliphila]MCJ8501709.1 dihydroorotate dehydrogenase-like protein [Desulfatitalea alkaliphila]
MDLSTRYLGLHLNNPIIAGSSGWTGSVEKIERVARAGAGAVVLKSIFEEEIAHEHEAVLKEAAAEKVPLDQFDYYDFHLRGKKLEHYLQLIKSAKSRVEIPVIASINCVYSHEWTAFARMIQEAGADAIELNMFFMPSDLARSGQEQEQIYFAIIEKLLKTVSIPVALKISYYFSNLAQTIQRLSRTGVAGLVLFNRFFSPDIDIEKLEIKPSFVFSTPAELTVSLRWIAIMAKKVDCDLAASTGVHDGAAVIKQLLAGAAAVQVASSLYRNGPEQISAMRSDLQSWMLRHKYARVADFRGKLSQDAADNPAVYERVQFMRYFGGEEKEIL